MVVGDVPWASYITPFGGANGGMARGPNKLSENSNKGSVAYGLWAIPKVGAVVLLACVDGDPNQRIYLGCLYDQYTPHTMPHGRFMDNTVGPLSSGDAQIMPLLQNYERAFVNFASPEWQSRGADFTVSAVDESQLEKAETDIPDDKKPETRQGYEVTRTELNHENPQTGETYESQTYSITTPGFHAISLDDRAKNCRIRIRSTAGHQILLDDSNERIYVCTAEGNNWIELDQNGNIDIFSARRISVHSEKDMNFTSDETIRMYGKKGVHIQSGGEYRVKAVGDITHKTDANINQFATTNYNVIANETVEYTAVDILHTTSGSMHLNSGVAVNVTASSGIDVKAGSGVTVEGSIINLGGPPAAAADKTNPVEPPDAHLPNKSPEHEPYPRVGLIDTDLDEQPKQTPEFGSDDSRVGREELGDTFDRGPNWRR